MPLLEQLANSLERRRHNGTLRQLTAFTPDTIASSSSVISSPSSLASRSSLRLADFSSNDYLSIATSSHLKQAFLRRVSQPGTRIGGSTGSRLLDGNNGGEIDDLESRLCRFFAASSALLCPSGWEANVSLFSSVPQTGDTILYDSLIHASVHDGMRRSRARCVSFEHSDLENFSRKLDEEVIPTLEHSGGNLFLAIEALYSMDGDFPPLRRLIDLVRTKSIFGKSSGRFWVVVDEAHSCGCFGQTGQGMCQLWDMRDIKDEEIVIRVATFGKGFGAAGAAVLCPPLVRQYLINYARPLIFSTAQAHASLLLIHAALDVLQSYEGAKRRARLAANCRLMLDCLIFTLGSNGKTNSEKAAFLSIGSLTATTTLIDESSELSLNRAVCNAADIQNGEDTEPLEEQAKLLHSQSAMSSSSASYSPIIPLLTPHKLTRPLATYLQGKGFLVRPITYPTVPRGRDRVRICVHADNTPEEIRGFCRAVGDWIKEQKMGPTGGRHGPSEGRVDVGYMAKDKSGPMGIRTPGERTSGAAIARRTSRL